MKFEKHYITLELLEWLKYKTAKPLLYTAGIWSRSRTFLESGFWPGVGVEVSHLEETLTPGPICFTWTFV